MKIGLVRHFKVIHKWDRKWMTSDQFNAWVEAYNNAEIEQSDLDYDYSEWTVCISSDLPRAIQTAETIYPGPIIATNRLREIEVQSIHPLGNLKLHYHMERDLYNPGMEPCTFSKNKRSTTKENLWVLFFR
ncbi:hypothetical protein DP091_07580 [Paenibacillus sp. MDMC362]|nr:hypothetical protein DP091_07580 [Paenibacillus sp. MDMC362]